MALRYAILHHTGVPEPHFDLLFETYPGSDLTTWRSPVWPILGRATITRLKAHRWLYLDYEGEVSQRRGRVERVAAGTCDVEVGPENQWTITLMSGSSPITLSVHPVVDDQWEAVGGDASTEP